jgi:hypothetical protein
MGHNCIQLVQPPAAYRLKPSTNNVAALQRHKLHFEKQRLETSVSLFRFKG